MRWDESVFLRELAEAEGGEVQVRRLTYCGRDETEIRRRCKRAGWAEFTTFGPARWVITLKGREALAAEDAR